MSSDVHLSYSRSYAVEVEHAFDEVLPFDLAELFDRRHLALPAISSVRDQAGAWGTPGQTRTIVLADGGTMREELFEVARPARFTYRITSITGPMKLLATSLDGAWEFEPVADGTRITWTWTLRPAGRLGGLAMPLFRRMWPGYARKGFDNLERITS